MLPLPPPSRWLATSACASWKVPAPWPIRGSPPGTPTTPSPSRCAGGRSEATSITCLMSRSRSSTPASGRRWIPCSPTTMTDETLPVARPRLRVLRPFRRWYRDLVIRRRAAFVVSYPKSGRTWLRLLLAHAFVPLTGRPLSLNLTVYRNRTLGIPYILFSHDGTDTAAWRGGVGGHAGVGAG